MAALRELLASFGVEVDTKALDKVDGQLSSLTAGLKKFGGALLSGAAVAGLHAFVYSVAEQGDELDKTSKRLGVTTDELQAYRHAAKLSGIDAAEASNSLRFLQKNLDDAATGGTEATEVFTRLGVTFQDSKGKIKDTIGLIPELAKGFAGIEDPATKTRLAMQLFGKSGAALIPLLNGGADGVHSLMGEFEALGGGISKEAIERSAELDDTTDRLNLAILSLKSSIAGALMPAFTWLIQKGIQVVTFFQKLSKETNIAKAIVVTFAALATAGLVKYAGAVSTAAKAMLGFAKPLLILAAIVLIVEDLITWFQGGDSVIGRFLDKLLGVGGSEKVLKTVKEAAEKIGVAFEEATEFVKNHAGEIVALAGVYIAYRAAVTAVTAAKGAYYAIVATIEATQKSYKATVIALTAAKEALTAGTWKSIAAAAAANLSFGALLLTVGAVAAAVGSLYAAWKQLSDLSDETEGLGITGIITQMAKQGTLDPAKAVDTYQNEQARLRSTGGPTSLSQTNQVEINITGVKNANEVAAKAGQAVSSTLRNERGAAFAALVGAGS